MKLNNEIAQLTEIYNNPKIGLKSKDLLKQYIIDADLDISDEALDEFYKNYEPIQQTKPANKPRKEKRLQITSDYPKNWYQADLMDLSKYEYTNRRYKWILCIIDIFSRYAWCFPLKDKTSRPIAECFDKVFSNAVPNKITTDNGKEFLNQQVAEVFKIWKVRHFTCQPGDHNHMGIVERFNRTLREKFTKLWTVSGNNRFEWVDSLQDIVYNYNHTKHSTLEASPFDVMSGREYNAQLIKDVEEPIFNINDRVRVKLELNKFDKGTLPKWSINTYSIIEKKGNKYLTSKDDKLRATHELQKIDQTKLIKPNADKVDADLLHRSRNLNRRRRI